MTWPKELGGRTTCCLIPGTGDHLGPVEDAAGVIQQDDRIVLGIVTITWRTRTV